MSPLNKQQLEQIRDERQEQIKQAALKVFARKGISGTKMNMIAEEAGASVGLAYRYFKSKEELFTILVQELLESASEEIDTTEYLPGTPFEQIQALTQNMLDENRYAFMFIYQARKAESVPEKVEKLLEQYSADALLERLVPIFEKGLQLGQFNEGDARQLLSWYLLVINQLLTQENGHKSYGMPNAAFLMRMIQHPSYKA
ncbi:TetR/AcrR family transcriptional regulator [Shimazuella sp. AN120528]|uniref:TetR/AcrR family transcriptional regulator n=1 Tax=Shimazuella soli TaxID=1892854 RepID=UPI001F0EC7C5|nr:TetR/AcrR family transcriptional regulator [Shimazuella soli]